MATYNIFKDANNIGKFSITQMIGDCSSFNVGLIGCYNYELSDFFVKSIVGLCLKEACLHQHFDPKNRDEYVNPVKNRIKTVKIILTHKKYYFEERGGVEAALIDYLKRLGAVVSTVNTTSWVGDNFQVKVISLPKSMYNWKDFPDNIEFNYQKGSKMLTFNFPNDLLLKNDAW